MKMCRKPLFSERKLRKKLYIKGIYIYVFCVLLSNPERHVKIAVPRRRMNHEGTMLSWQNLSVYAMDRNRRTISKQLINNGI